MFTGGLGMFGSIYDFFTLPDQVREANFRRELFDRTFTTRRTEEGHGGGWRYVNDAEFKVMKKNHAKEHPERVILKLAKENKGVISVSDLALGADISIEEAQKHLDTLVSKGYAQLRVRKSGTLAYVIPDMADKDEPLEDF